MVEGGGGIKWDWVVRSMEQWRWVAPTAKPRTYTQEELIECHANKRRQFHAPLPELASSQSHCDEIPSEVMII